MADVAHTRGPWRVGADLIRVHTDWRDESGSCTPENFHRNGYAKTIATVGKEDGDWRNIEQQVADARLIAAAPDLLAVAQRILDRGYVSEHIDEERGDHIALCAAIAAALSSLGGDGR